jgi:dUTP diphosphatase
MRIKYRYVGNYEKPKKQTLGSAGIDLFNNTDKDITIKPSEYAIISTGFYVEIPEGYGGLLFAHGSLGFKYGCTLTNSVGVIDSDYRGEVMARITNISQETHTIKAGERCVQLVIVPVPDTEYVEEELSDTERGISGFGSTGRN